MSENDEVVGLATRTRLWKAVEADPDGYVANRDMGLYCSTRKNFVLLAEPYLRKALSLNVREDERPPLLFRLAQICTLKGEFQEAWEIFSSLIGWHPEEIALELGYLSFYMGDLERASGLFGSSVDMASVRAKKLAAERGEPDTRLLVPNKVVCTHIGEAIHKLDLFVKARKLGLIEDFRAILLAPAEYVVNPCLLDYWRDHIEILSDPAEIRHAEDWLVERRYNLDFLTVSDGLTLNRDIACWVVQPRWEAEGRPPLLTLKDDHRRKGEAALCKLGLPDGAWFACLQVRDSGFHSEGVEWSHNRHRNGRVDDYFAAIEAVTGRGGWVVRIGDPTMTRLPDMPNVIDYAHCEAKSDWLDIYCMAAARFYFGTTSGPQRVSHAFGVPIALTNSFPMWSWPHSRDVLLAHKLLYKKDEDRNLSWAEIAKTPVFAQIFSAFYEDRGLEVIDNSADEIRATVEEMLDRLEGTACYSEEDEQLQKKFASRVDIFGFGFSPRVSRAFLKAHPELLADPDTA